MIAANGMSIYAELGVKAAIFVLLLYGDCWNWIHNERPKLREYPRRIWRTILWVLIWIVYTYYLWWVA